MWKFVPIKPERKLRQVDNAEAIFDQFFESFFDEDLVKTLNKLDNESKCFAVDVIDAGDKYLVNAELVGFKKEDVKLEYSNSYLIITAWREEEDEPLNYIRRERNYGLLKRSFYVDGVDPETISASFDNGILRIVLDKKIVKHNSRKILIE